MTSPATSGPVARPEVHHDHRDVTGGWLRPAVFGAMDGLISNFSLISGFSGAHASRHLVILSGLGGLVGWRILDGGRRVRVGGFAGRPRPR